MQMIRESASHYDNPTNQLGYEISNFQSILESLSIDEEILDDNFKIYPNPVSEKLFVDMQEKKPIRIKLFSIDGKELRSGTIADIEYISVEGLSTGLYLLEITLDNKRYTS